MRSIMYVLPLLMCAACNKEPSVKVDNATAEEVVQKVKDSGIAETMMKPGQWQYQMMLVDMSSPKMPPDQVARMKEAMNRPQTTERCVTAEDFKTANIGDIPKSCTFDHYEIGGGKIEGKMRCTNAGLTQETNISGSYTEDSSDVTVTSTRSGAPAPLGDMTVTMNMKGKRIGDCPKA